MFYFLGPPPPPFSCLPPFLVICGEICSERHVGAKYEGSSIFLKCLNNVSCFARNGKLLEFLPSPCLSAPTRPCVYKYMYVCVSIYIYISKFISMSSISMSVSIYIFSAQNNSMKEILIEVLKYQFSEKLTL